MVRKELSPWEIIRRSRNYCIAGAVMVAVLFILNRFLISGIINTAILIAVGACSYFTVLLVLRDHFFLNNINIILTKMKGKISK